jgi:ribosomal protein L29
MEDISKKSKSELHKLLAEKRLESRKFRFEMSGGKIKNVKLGNQLKKEIARILTAMRSANE